MNQDLDLDTTPAKKLGKPKLIYGVDNKKFSGTKAKANAIDAISKTSSESEFEKRELVFAKLRPEIQEQLSNTHNRISHISKGFWQSYQHLAHQFEYLTGSADLTAAVKQNLVVQIGHLEKFLIFFDKSIEFTEKLAAVEAECELKFQGALLYKYIMIMRFAGSFF